MKKKILGLCMVACLGVTVAGCAADLDDVEKQVTKMEKIIDEKEVFEDDWAVTFSMSSEYGTAEIFLQKDGDNYYYKWIEPYADGVESAGIWILKDGAGYNVYDEEFKEYFRISGSELDDYLDDMGFEDYAIEEAYEAAIEILKEIPKVCSQDAVTCEFEKNLFGKLTATVAVKEGERTKTTTLIVKNGKLLSMGIDYNGEGLLGEIDYGNQKIEPPADKDEYKMVNN